MMKYIGRATTYIGIKTLLLLTLTVLLLGDVHAARPGDGGGGGAPSCTISQPQNDPVSITTGGSALFMGVISGGTAPYDVTWTFEGGSPASANETLSNSGDQTSQYDVAFEASGNYTVTLAATDSNSKRSKSCSATRTINVSDGTGNSRPVAQNDEYNTTQETELVVDAPGVLSNDNDPDGDPMNAIVLNYPSNGVLALNVDGSFSYNPNIGFTGSDFFTYKANDAGGQSNLATVTIGVAAAGQVSINSTSANGALPSDAVAEQPFTSNPGYQVLAINDLGMHCGDLDTRISSILPPFNVLHAQVVERGVTGLPRVMGEGEATLFYSAASNPNDPALSKSVPDQALSSVTNGNVYKTNFWDIASQAYAPFYPEGILPLFYDSVNSANNVDKSLPVPDVERLYLEDGGLHATQQAMPGFSSPYSQNVPQEFHEHFTDFPFFVNFPFGYVADGVNWFEAAGMPIAAFDDFGRENPYPLVRVEAKWTGLALPAWIPLCRYPAKPNVRRATQIQMWMVVMGRQPLMQILLISSARSKTR